MLGHGNGDLGQYGYHAPYRWKSFLFSKDGRQGYGRLVPDVEGVE
jgi:hypothetical protein